MRALPTRTRLAFAMLLSAVFLYCALGVLVTCHAAGSAPRADGIERVAVTAALPGTASCPDCVPGSGEARSPGSADAVGGSHVDPCHPDRPCQHGATHGYAAATSTSRAPDSGTQSIPVVPLLFAAPALAGHIPASVCPTGPVPPPAVQEPVAVLCVDRN